LSHLFFGGVLKQIFSEMVSEKEFQGLLECDPNYPQTRRNLTVADTKKGDKAKAGEKPAKLEKLAPDNQSVQKLRADIEQIK